MKRKFIAYIGAAVILTSSILSCDLNNSNTNNDDPGSDSSVRDGTELDVSNYSEITDEAAEEIINSYDVETAFNELDTLVYETKNNYSIEGLVGISISSASETREEIDFRDESLYLYSSDYSETEISSTIYPSSYAFLINGSGDSYKEEYLIDSEFITNDLTLEEAKSTVDTYSSSLFSEIAYSENTIFELDQLSEEYEVDISYSTYRDYLKIDLILNEILDEEESETTSSTPGSAYAIYNGDGLLIYAYGAYNDELSVPMGEISFTLGATNTGYYSAEYNVDLDKISTLSVEES